MQIKDDLVSLLRFDVNRWIELCKQGKTAWEAISLMSVDKRVMVVNNFDVFEDGNYCVCSILENGNNHYITKRGKIERFGKTEAVRWRDTYRPVSYTHLDVYKRQLPSILGIRGARDKPRDSYGGSAYSFFFGRSTSGKAVNERTAMQTTAVYSCVRILSEAVASLPIHVYRYTDTGKERVYDHPLYHLLHDEPNPEMTSFVFRETLMSHLLIWGNAYAQIIRDGNGRVLALYPLLPDKMEADRDENGRLYYIYTRNSDENPNCEEYGRVYLREQDVLHIPGLGFDGLVGYCLLYTSRCV